MCSTSPTFTERFKIGWDTSSDNMSRMCVGHLQAVICCVYSFIWKTKDVYCNVALLEENECCYSWSIVDWILLLLFFCILKSVLLAKLPKAATIFAPGVFCVPFKGCSSIILCLAMKISTQQLKTTFGRLFEGFWVCFSPLFAKDFSGLVSKIKTRLFRLDELVGSGMFCVS